jgi:chloride channel protein, CIC family
MHLNVTRYQRFSMVVLAFLVGAGAGVSAWLFHHLISLLHNLCFAHQLSFEYEATVFTAPSAWGWGHIGIMVSVAVVVAYIIKHYAPEAKGHGVPEVMHAIYFKQAFMRPISIIAKAITAAMTIGSGGSVGREGPIVQICAGLGSLVRFTGEDASLIRSILVSAGASAGIAATFNAPLGGLLFAVELMLPIVNVWSLFVVIIATVVSTYVGGYLVDIHPVLLVPSLAIPSFQLNNPLAYLGFVVLGVLVGLLSYLFIVSLYWFEDFFSRRFPNPYVCHMFGMAIVGLMIMSLMHFFGHYYLSGSGYPSILEVLRGLNHHYELLLLLVGLKLLATCITIGSGGSGGIFSPSLFLGALLGGAYGLFGQEFFPGLHLNPIDCGVAGMAAMVSATTGGVMMGTVIVVEMTRDFNDILPILWVSAIAAGVRFLLIRDSMYSLKLARRESYFKQGLLSFTQPKGGALFGRVSAKQKHDDVKK